MRQFPKFKMPDEFSGNCQILLIETEMIPILGIWFEQLQWRSRWDTDEDYEDGYQWAQCLQLRLTMAGCTESLIEAIQSIKGTMLACCDMGYTYATAAGMPVTDEEPEEYEHGEGDPPDGSATWGEFDAEYCKRLQWFIDHIGDALDDMKDEIELVGGLSMVVVTGIVILAALTLPVAALVALVGGFLAIAASETLDDVVEDFNAAKTDLLCAMFDVLTPADAFTAYNQAVDDMDTVSLYKKIYHNMVSMIDINGMWDGTTGEEAGYSGDPCESCGGDPLCLPGYVVNGDITIGDFYESTMTVSSVYNTSNCGNHYRVFVQLCSGNGERTFKLSALSGFTPKICSIGYNWAVWERDDGGGVVEVIKENNATPDLEVEWCANLLQIMSNTPFTVTITWINTSCTP